MTDLVARLCGTALYYGHGEESDIPEQAADEIERLRKQVRDLDRENAALRFGVAALKEGKA